MDNTSPSGTHAGSTGPPEHRGRLKQVKKYCQVTIGSKPVWDKHVAVLLHRLAEMESASAIAKSLVMPDPSQRRASTSGHIGEGYRSHA